MLGAGGSERPPYLLPGLSAAELLGLSLARLGTAGGRSHGKLMGRRGRDRLSRCDLWITGAVSGVRPSGEKRLEVGSCG